MAVTNEVLQDRAAKLYEDILNHKRGSGMFGAVATEVLCDVEEGVDAESPKLPEWIRRYERFVNERVHALSERNSAHIERTHTYNGNIGVTRHVWILQVCTSNLR